MHTVFALLCFVVVIHWLIFPYPSGLLHWHCGNLTIAPVPAKQPWWIWINTSCEFIMGDCVATTKQSTTKPCAYFLGYTVCPLRKTFMGRRPIFKDPLFRRACSLCFCKMYFDHPHCTIINVKWTVLVQLMAWRQTGVKPLTQLMLTLFIVHISWDILYVRWGKHSWAAGPSSWIRYLEGLVLCVSVRCISTTRIAPLSMLNEQYWFS